MFKEFDVFFDSDNNCFQIRTKNNCYTLDFEDDARRVIFEQLVKMESDNLSGNFNTLVKTHPKALVIDVFASLRDYGLLSPEGTSEIPELLSGEVCSPSAQPLKNLEDQKVIVISDNVLGKHLSEILISRGIANTKLLSAALFASFSSGQIDELMVKTDFFFADASAWNPKALELLNKYAIKHNKPWLHIGGVEEYQAKVGPLFLGDASGCYDCLISRIKSNHSYVPYFNAYEAHLRNQMKSSKPDTFIHIESYNAVISHYAYLEFTKFVQFWSIPSTWRKVLMVNMLTFESQSHDLLKVPFCETCNHDQFYNPSPWLEPISLNGV